MLALDPEVMLSGRFKPIVEALAGFLRQGTDLCFLPDLTSAHVATYEQGVSLAKEANPGSGPGQFEMHLN
jgi:hypothetical protein